ncbi:MULTISPECIES: RhuM family protein [unclassified Bradyrhizobium]
MKSPKITKLVEETKETVRITNATARVIEMKSVHYKTGNRDIPFNIDLTAATVWATQNQISDLYGRDKATIREHIKNVYLDGELTSSSVERKFPSTAADGKTYEVIHYSLPLILAVGFRTKSPEAVEFRRWANEILQGYLQDGYALNEKRLRADPTAADSLAKRLRAIRAEEKHLFASVRDFFKEAAVDYDPLSRTCKSFYAVVQDKFHYAVSAMTAAEIILDRANHKHSNMGLQTFEGNLPTVQEAKVGKNYLEENELFALHILAEQFLLYVQSKAVRNKVMTMADLSKKLDELIAVNDYEVFGGYKSGVSRQRADEHATEQYARFLVRLRKDDVRPIR